AACRSRGRSRGVLVRLRSPMPRDTAADANDLSARVSSRLATRLPLLGLGALLLLCWQRTRPRQEPSGAQRQHTPRAAAEHARRACGSAGRSLDPVTGLPGEAALTGELRGVLECARAADSPAALVRIDLLGLEIVRSVAGAGAGDEAIATVA